jgi:hypothetical protein
MRLRTVIEGLRNAPASDQAQGAGQNILDIEQANGGRFIIVDGEPHLFTGFGKKLLPLQHGDPRWAAHLLMIYGLNTKDKEVSPKITNVLASFALWNGAKMSPRRWTAFVDGALYLSRYNGTMLRLTGSGVEEDERGFLVDDAWRRGTPAGTNPIVADVIDNGRTVLFADDDSGSMPDEPVIGRNGRLFRILRGVNWSRSTVGGLKPKHQVQVLMIWMLATAFPDIFPTKPILLVEGAPNSGKSTLMQMIQQALFGAIEPFVVSENGERDFWVALMRSPLMVLDNADDLIDWLPSTINAYVTRGYRTERRLHTNTGRVEIRPQSFIAVASKDPKSFRREDTADRSIVLRMDSRFVPGGVGGDSAQALTAAVAQDRARIYGEWLYYLNRVVAALRLEPPRRTTTRLGDFELFAYAACRALGWQSSVVVPDLMAALGRERAVFAAEADIVLDIINDWISGFPANEGRQISVRDLFRDLAMLAQANNKPFVKTPQALAQRLRAPHMRVAFDIYDQMIGDKRIYQIFTPQKPTEAN